MDTVKDTLTQNIADLNKQLADVQAHIVALQHDGDYLWYLSRVDILKTHGYYGKTSANNYYWADGSGTIWAGKDSDAAYKKGTAYISNIEHQISDAQAQEKAYSDPATGKIALAQKALNEYNTGLTKTPEAQQALAKVNYAQTNVKYLIIAGVVIVVVVISVIMYIKIKKRAI